MSSITNLGNFPHTIGNLDDQPNLPADKMKEALEKDCETLWDKVKEVVPSVNNSVDVGDLDLVIDQSSTDGTAPSARAVYTAISDLAEQIGIISWQGLAAVYNVTHYGIMPNTGDDLYDSLFDFLHNVVAATGGVVYFPEGTYTISDTIFIPPNTTFCGAGKATRIVFTEANTSFGIGLANGGSNVAIVNMTVDCNNNAQIIATSMPGAIGFSTHTFASWTTKHILAGNMQARASCENLRAEKLWTNTRYILQTETTDSSDTLTINNLVYKDINAEKSLVSIGGHDNINNVIIQNVTCAWLRVGHSGETNNTNVFVSDVFTGRAFFYGQNIIVGNLILLPSLKYDTADDLYTWKSAVALHGSVQLSDSIINAGSYERTFYRSVRPAGDNLTITLRLDNVSCFGSTSGVFTNGLSPSDPDFSNVYITGCNLQTAGSGLSVIYGYMGSTIFPTLNSSSDCKPFNVFRSWITSSVDLDTLKSPNKCYVSVTPGNTVTNGPSDLSGPFYLDIDTYYFDGTDAGLQTIVLRDGSAVYRRSFSGSQFGQWYKFS